MARPTASPVVLARQQRQTFRWTWSGPNQKVPVKLIDELRRGLHQFSVQQRDSQIDRANYDSRLWRIASALGTNGQSKLNIIGEMFSDMFIGNTNLEDECKWVPVKPLGHGSYGAAALFKHSNSLDNTDDYVVLKYTNPLPSEMVPGWSPHMSMEAAIMMQLNELGSDGVLFLRDFVTFRNKSHHCYYLEYCPNLDLEQLRVAHKAMQREIPAPLIFYFFYTLAKGLQVMEEGPFGDYKTPHIQLRGAFILHRDMKPANTFVGYPAAPQPPGVDDPGLLGAYLKYPVAKIADFGLSRITTLADDQNKARKHQGKGSLPWIPPEMRVDRLKENTSPYYAFKADRYGPDGAQLSFDRTAEDKFEHAYTPAGNMFVLGYMMYQLITLDEYEDMYKYVDEMVLEEETPVITFDPDHMVSAQEELDMLDHQLQGYGLTDDEFNRRRNLRGRLRMLKRWHSLPTDPVLKVLVENCMSFVPQDRNTAEALVGKLEEAMANIVWNLQRLEARDLQDFEETTKVYTAEQDLPDMPRGTFAVVRDENFWQRFLKTYKWIDATGGGLRPLIDMTDPDIPQEVKDLFHPGYGEQRNAPLLRGVNMFNTRVVPSRVGPSRVGPSRVVRGGRRPGPY